MKISTRHLAEIEQSILKFIWNLSSQNNLEKENKAGRLRVPKFKTDYKATLIKIAWSWHKDRHGDEGTRVESLGIKPHTCGQMTVNKGKGKDSLPTNGAGKLCNPMQKYAIHKR